jgi:hypothetical protein
MSTPFAEVHCRTTEHADPAYAYDVELDGVLNVDFDSIATTYLAATPSPAWRQVRTNRFLFNPRAQPNVLDAGEDVVFVPLIGCAAPALEGAAAQVTYSTTAGTTSELGFTLFGTGPKRSVEITMTSIDKLAVAAGQAKTFGILQPVLWRLVRFGSGDDDPQTVVVEPAPSSGVDKPTVTYRDGLTATELVSRQRLDAATAPSGSPQTHETSYQRTSTTSMQLGAKLESIGLQVTLTLALKQSITIEGTVTTPPDHQFLISWFAGPPSLRLTVESEAQM